MKQWAKPLLVFVSGNLLLLVILLFLPGVEDAELTLAAETAESGAFAWGWSWITSVGVVRFLVFLVFEGLILWSTGKAFLSSR